MGLKRRGSKTNKRYLRIKAFFQCVLDFPGAVWVLGNRASKGRKRAEMADSQEGRQDTP